MKAAELTIERTGPRPDFADGLPASRRRWTDSALQALPRDGRKYELMNGEITTMSPAGFNHGDICLAIAAALRAFARKNRLGKVVEGQTGFRLEHGVTRKTVLSPDASFVSAARLAAVESLDGFLVGAPDLAVEVLSLGDSLAQTRRKVALYLRNGTRLAWIVDPVAKEVQIYRPDGSVESKQLHETLSGGEVLPGFKLPVRAIFD